MRQIVVAEALAQRAPYARPKGGRTHSRSYRKTTGDLKALPSSPVKEIFQDELNLT